MDLFLQFGYGMKALTIDLAKTFSGISVILSPRDMNPKQLVKCGEDFRRAGVRMYFDPQCFCPKSEMKNLCQYSYWNSKLNTQTESGKGPFDEVLLNIKLYNDDVQTEAYILPAILNPYDSDWADRFLFQTKRFIDSAQTIMDDKPLYATLAIPKGFLIQSGDIIDGVLQNLIEFDVDGYYVIAETPEKKYLVDNPQWLSNVLQICAALKIAGKKVIFGYGNHQMLPLSLIKIDAMASGTWLNVRSFTNRFVDSDEFKRRTTWVYYPEALSEYKLSFMDFAYNNKVMDTMRSTDREFLDDGIRKLFRAEEQPSATGFSETDAFKHYLFCLKHQVELLNKKSYQDAMLAYEVMLATAEREIERLEKLGVYAQSRGFKDVIDVNRAAITWLDRSFGFQIKMMWDKL